MLMARGKPFDGSSICSPPLPFWTGSSSGSMLEARLFRGDEDRLGSSASPFMMALLEYRKGDWLLPECSAEPVSSPPRSLSSDSSAYAEAQGDEAADEAYSTGARAAAT